MITNKDIFHIPILAEVTFANSVNHIAALHSFEQRNIQLVSPKGYYYLPSVKDKILLTSSINPIATGCLLTDKVKINQGEIIIKNESGGYIKLLSNGNVEINSMVITTEGKIMKN